MAIELEPQGMQKITVLHANSLVRNTMAENFEGFDLELVELSLGEDLENQEILYQSFSDNARNDQATIRSTDAAYDDYHEQSSGGETSSRNPEIDAQLAYDEALARQLQEMEDFSIHTPPNERTDVEESSSETGESSNANNEGEAARQDGVEPDNLSYEALRSLDESVGTESKGLSEELISYLESSKYRSRIFSRKGNEECVICQSAYRNREKLITLPCKHYFHKVCITTWLKINKTCPVCKYEVFGPS